MGESMEDDERALKRLCTRGALISGFSNLDGALFTFIFLEFIAPTEKPTKPVGVGRDTLVFVVFMVASLLLIGLRERRTLLRALGWLGEGREPSEHERS